MRSSNTTMAETPVLREEGIGKKKSFQTLRSESHAREFGTQSAWLKETCPVKRFYLFVSHSTCTEQPSLEPRCKYAWKRLEGTVANKTKEDKVTHAHFLPRQTPKRCGKRLRIKQTFNELNIQEFSSTLIAIKQTQQTKPKPTLFTTDGIEDGKTRKRVQSSLVRSKFS